MSEIILDFGSGNTCQNDRETIIEMIDQLKAIDSGKHNIIIKWQLFENVGNNIPLNRNLFVFALRYAKDKGYKTTASVFDEDSLKFLLGFHQEIPFIKIANNKKYLSLIGLIPRKIKVYLSIPSEIDKFIEKYGKTIDACLYNLQYFYCISEYPATTESYENAFMLNTKKLCYISDHTTNFYLFNTYKPQKIEWHYKLENSKGLDSGPFARTPEQLNEIL